MKRIQVEDISDLPKAASNFLTHFTQAQIVAFDAEMGGGKTTFIKELCKQLNVNETVNSPTFSIVNEYSTKDNQLVYHFDLYRLKDVRELLDIGFEDYLHQDAWVFIEWPQIAEPFLPENTIFVTIEEQENGVRTICF